MKAPKETVDVLRRLDVDELRTFLQIAYPPSNELEERDLTIFLEAERKTILAAAHKARNALGPMNFTQAELRESREWLTTNGYRTGITKHRNH